MTTLTMSTWRYENDLFIVLAVPHTNKDMDPMAHTCLRLRNVARFIMDPFNFLIYGMLILVGLAIVIWYLR